MRTAHTARRFTSLWSSAWCTGLNAEDDEGLDWSTLSDARHASRIRPGEMLVAGNRHAHAVVRVVAVDQDGQVHFTVLPGSLEKVRLFTGRAPGLSTRPAPLVPPVVVPARLRPTAAHAFGRRFSARP